MAVAAALISALSDKPVAKEAVFFGEVALSGEVRPVAHGALRMREAAKLGFERAIGPVHVGADKPGLSLAGYKSLSQYVDAVLGRG
jgi:DNA repair protein RadA/Sms